MERPKPQYNMRFSVSLFLLFFVSYVSAQTLVLPGDFPDPSVVKSGDTFWATATTSNWAPAFPLLQSKDLIHWELKGHVFDQLPAWADYYFWAPEITHDKGKYYVYYAAHKRDGNLCVAVASADKPEGPYTDHGPLMCQKAGSIDAWPMRDNDGKLYLIWKEDGNSLKLPTPIWAMQVDEEHMKLIGDQKELFRNDSPWEGNLVEGVSMIRRGDYLYAFYAGAGCCGRACSYGIGVARAKHLLGPWEKYGGNPVIATNDEWKCPGHGTPIEKDGKYYFLYHAYARESNVYAGRQGVLSEFTFTDDGWIEFRNGPEGVASIQPEIKDEFDGRELSNHWQWSVFQKPKTMLRNGQLELNSLPEKSGSFLAAKTYTGNYDATVTVIANASDADAGLGLVGDEKNFVVASIEHSRVVLRKVESAKETVIETKSIRKAREIRLRLQVKDGKDILFFYSTDGKKFLPLNGTPVDGFFLPPWDRAVRVALVSRGESAKKAVFDHFILKNN
jgi:xylan 1,4-beta-xylosidase